MDAIQTEGLTRLYGTCLGMASQPRLETGGDNAFVVHVPGLR